MSGLSECSCCLGAFRKAQENDVKMCFFLSIDKMSPQTTDIFGMVSSFLMHASVCRVPTRCWIQDNQRIYT